MLVKKNILGIDVTDANLGEVLEYIIKGLEKQQKPYFIVTPNPEILVYVNKHKDFKKILNSAELALCDGVGLFLASKFLGKPLKGRITGVSFMQELCKRSVRKPITMGFLGGRPGVALKTAECLREKYPGLQVVFAGSEWSGEKTTDYRLQTTAEKRNAVDRRPLTVDVLFVAFGSPKQEKWMAEHLGSGAFRVAVGVGGAFDFVSGQVPRAPIWLQNIGLEWLFRLIIQPWRIKRQLALFEFVYLVLREKFQSSIKPS